MLRRPDKAYLILCCTLSTCLTLCYGLVHLEKSGSSRVEWSLEQAHPGQGEEESRGRNLQAADIQTIKGLPARFTIRPMVDPSLCVHRVTLQMPVVTRARARSNLPKTDPEEVEEYGSTRLILLPCTLSRTDVYMAETVLGRFYQNNGTNYRLGFLKPPTETSVCVYGVNTSYTDGHAVFGVTGTEYYKDQEEDADADKERHYENGEMDWFDEYTFDYAPYLRYGYDPATMVISGTFQSPNPLPLTMLDASSWGPFHISWGTCMPNPTLDSSMPVDDPNSELELRYHSWTFVDVPETLSTSHLPPRVRKMGFAIMTLGPDRPQPDMSPLAGEVDAGDLSAQLGGGDKPYGTGYSSLVSNELCMTTSVIREGAQVWLAPCNPVAPSLEQVFQLVPAGKVKSARSAKAAKGVVLEE